MSKLKPVKCRICGGSIDREALKEGIDWIMPSKNWFYHVNCYQEWVNKADDVAADATNDEWFGLAYKYLRQELLISIDFPKMQKQWDSLLKKRHTAKGIFFALKYFYNIQHGDKSKAEGGIGIVDYIYENSCNYWASHQQQMEIVSKEIIAQMRNLNNVQVVNRTTKHRKKKTMDDIFAQIGGDDNDC